MLELAPMTAGDGLTIRSELQPGDVEAITALHARVYTAEHDVGPAFVTDVHNALQEAIGRGWPQAGGVRLVEADGGLAGTAAWTEEGDRARIRWILLGERLRGRGLGRTLVEAMLEEAHAAGYQLVELVTFSALRRAAGIYRSLGFVVVDSQTHVSWGPVVELQRYERRREVK